MAADLVLAVESLAHDGRGIGFLPGSGGRRGLAVFIAGALPGQKVACTVAKSGRNMLEATLVSVLEQPDDFIRPCRHYQECGGCPLGQMPYSRQLFWKESLARDSFLRIGRFSAQEFAAVWHKPLRSPQIRNFRNKIELAFGIRDGALMLGFRKRGSHDVFDLSDCALVEASVLSVINSCREIFNRPGFITDSGWLRNLVLCHAPGIVSESPGWHVLLLTGNCSTAQRKAVLAAGRKLLATNCEMLSFIHEERKAADFIVRGDRRIACLGRDGIADPGAAIIRRSLGGRDFLLDSASFFQVNNASAELLAQLAGMLDAGEGPLLDVYCGVGAPGQLLAQRHGECLGLERDRSAITFAQRNAAAAGLQNWRYVAADALSGLRKLANSGKAWQSVLLDPPRAGAGRAVIAAIDQLAPARIVYVSCNPVTMARDAAALADHYRLHALHSVDMFPHTPTLECVGLWTRIS